MNYIDGNLLTEVQFGGEAGIRTLGGVSSTTVFETVPFGRSGTSPSEDIDTNIIFFLQQDLPVTAIT